jgi:hypothetical protein
VTVKYHTGKVREQLHLMILPLRLLMRLLMRLPLRLPLRTFG